MDNNYKEIRGKNLGETRIRCPSWIEQTFSLSRERNREKETERKKRKRKNNRRYNSFHFVQITESSIQCGATLSFFFFDPSPADGGRWEAVSMFTREIVRVVLSCGGGGGRIRGLPMRCWRHHRSCGSSHDRCSYEGKENEFFNTTSLNIHHKSVHNPTLFNIQSHNILITSFEALLRPCITYSAWMRFIITRSLNTNQINPY